MPSTIPYDPSLVLASVVSPEVLKNVESIAQAQAPVDTAQDSLNSLIHSKRSLDMTRTELKNLGVETKTLDDELKKLNDSIGKAAAAYATAKVAAQPQITQLREKIRSVHTSVESPVDYLKTGIKSMALAADTMNMDVQYFSFDSNSQSAASFSSQIASYISTSLSFAGDTGTAKLASSAAAQVSNQVSKHSIEGTLVLSVSCTHKMASVLAPFVLHVDKAIKVWNTLFPKNILDPTDRGQMLKMSLNKSQENKEKYSIISGVTFGSSFVGLVHILNKSETSASDSLISAAESMSASWDVSSWIAKSEGKLGVDSKFAADLKNLLSSQNVTSHVTLLTMGIIPSVKSSEVQIAVDKFLEFDPKTNMGQVMAMQEATDGAQRSISSDANSARTGEQSTEVEGKKIQASLSALAQIDDGKNKVLDINSMMTALEAYLDKAATGDCGVPINYYIKDIDQKMLAEMWAAKYYPGKYLSIKHDDGSSAAPTGGDGGGGGAEEPAKANL